MLKKVMYITGSILVLASQSSFAEPELPNNLKSALNEIYEGYSDKHQCWRYHADEPDYFYCFKLDRVDFLKNDQESRAYLLLTGSKYNEDGESGAHVDSGMVGAFVLSNDTQNIKVLAGSLSIPVGAFGQAPTGWQWVKLGPSNYWGWKNTWGDAHQGIGGSRYSILAPYGKGIKDVAGFVESYSDEGNCDTESGCKPTIYNSLLEIDSTQIQDKVFPLMVTVSGNEKGKALKEKTWSIPFDTKTWSYQEPSNWPLKDLDF